MDRNTVIGFFLIFAVLTVFSILNRNDSKVEENKQENKITKTNNDSKKTSIDHKKEDVISVIDTIANNTVKDSLQDEKLIKSHGIFAKSINNNSSKVIIENNKLILTFNSKGAQLVEAQLKEYQSYSNFVKSKSKKIIEPLKLFDEKATSHNLSFTTYDLKDINTADLNFEVLSKTDSNVVFKASTTEPDKYLLYEYKLGKNKYDFDYNIKFVNLSKIIDGSTMRYYWKSKALKTEKEDYNARMKSNVFFKYKDGSYDYLSEASEDEENIEVQTDWIAFKSNYFSTFLINKNGFGTKTFIKSGPTKIEDTLYYNYYESNINISQDLYNNNSLKMNMYIGPNDYKILASYNNQMEDVINLGWKIFRWVNKWMIMPIFNFFNNIIVQIGVVILIVTIIIRLVISPLTYKNYVSSARMKVLRPEITALNEKYKSDAMKRQSETMALYRRSGVNPMAGCIPIFVQMPILIAAFRYFPSELALRQRSFLWAEDLSTFESVVTLPMNIPMYGSHVSLITVLLAVSTFFYTKLNTDQMSMPQQPGMPNMKFFMYLTPIMLLLFMNQYSSGLNLYYLFGNLISMGLMYLVKKFMVDEAKIISKIESNKKNPKKKSKFMQRLEEAQKNQMNQMNKKKK